MIYIKVIKYRLILENIEGWRYCSMENEYIYCKLCGRKLKSEQSKLLGYGPSCFRKVNQVHSKKLFDEENNDKIEKD